MMYVYASMETPHQKCVHLYLYIYPFIYVYISVRQRRGFLYIEMNVIVCSEASFSIFACAFPFRMTGFVFHIFIFFL